MLGMKEDAEEHPARSRPERRHDSTLTLIDYKMLIGVIDQPKSTMAVDIITMRPFWWVNHEARVPRFMIICNGS